MSARPAGDRGVDFRVFFQFDGKIAAYPVDIKTARKAFNLIVESGKVDDRTIYVLAQYENAADNASLIGWEWGAAIKKAPVRDFGYGILSHYIHRNSLRPMEELKQRLVAQKEKP